MAFIKINCAAKSTADRLVEQMLLWIKKGEDCARNLKELATELESLREGCNVAETVGNTTAAVGSAVMLVAPFTGPFAPAVALVGLGMSLGGTGVTITSKITEHFCSSSKLENVQKIDRDCREIGQKIKELFEKLKDESGSKDEDQQLKHAISEFLKAFAKQKGLANIKHLNIDDLLSSLIRGPAPEVLLGGLTVALMAEILHIFNFFALNVGGKILGNVIVGGGKVAKDLAVVGGKAVLKESFMILGGLVGLAISLPDAIQNWKDLINKNENEASRKIREAANAILESVKKLTKMMEKTENMLTQAIQTNASASSRKKDTKAEAVDKLCHSFLSMNKAVIAQKQRAGQSGAAPPGGGRGGDGPKKPEKEEESSEEESSDSEDETGKKNRKKKNRRDQRRVLQMALLNVRSVRTRAYQLRRLISDENLDFLVLTETWLEPGQEGDDELRNLLPQNRNFIQLSRDSRGGGVAIVFSNEFQFTQIHLQRVDSFEYVAGVVQHESWDHPVVIISVYHTTSTSREELDDFLFELQMLLYEVYDNYSHSVIVAGDFNIWIDQPGWQEIVFNRFLRDSGLEQFVNQPTHQQGHILDLVLGRFVTIPRLFVRDDRISDHWTVYFIVRPLTKEEVKKKK